MSIDIDTEKMKFLPFFPALGELYTRWNDTGLSSFLGNSTKGPTEAELLDIIGDASRKQESVLTVMCAHQSKNFEVLLAPMLREFGVTYIPTYRAEIRNELREQVARVNLPIDITGWLPLDNVGPGIILAHFLPNFPKPEIPDLLVHYVMITDREYFNLAEIVRSTDFEAQRFDSKYTFEITTEIKELCKNPGQWTVSNFGNLLKNLCPAGSPQMLAIEDVQAHSQAVGVESLTAFIDRIDSKFTTWLQAKEAELSNQNHFGMNLDKKLLSVVNMSAIALSEREQQFLITHGKFCEETGALPIYVSNEFLILGSPHAHTQEWQNKVTEKIDAKDVFYVLITEKEFREILEARKQEQATMGAITIATKGLGEGKADGGQNIEAILGEENDVEDSVILFCNQVLSNAIEEKASDIHFEAHGDKFRIRYRVDGRLMFKFAPMPIHIMPNVIRRIKTMASLDITKQTIPHDGRIKINYKKRSIDLRVATCPLESGAVEDQLEKAVIRILDETTAPDSFDKVCWHERQRTQWRNALAQSFGIIIVAGPTGSGKSTTLYAALNELNQPDVNVVTAEDPVERRLIGINQTLVQKPNTFAGQLRSFMRMDPDIILVGEVRDIETAGLALQASQTGHLVLTTLHANTAISALTRLDHLKVERTDAANSLLMLTSQRLVRCVCRHCQQKHSIRPEDLQRFQSRGINSKYIEGGFYFSGRGCQKCNNSGYKGRTSVMELLPIDESMKTIMCIESNKDIDIKTEAIRMGFVNMYHTGLELVARGQTDFRELLSEIPDVYF